MTFCLLVCQMCEKGTFSQIRSHLVLHKCDRILENLPFGHKLTFWENSNENFNNNF